MIMGCCLCGVVRYETPEVPAISLVGGYLARERHGDLRRGRA